MQSRRIIIIACINTVYKAQITWYRKYEIKWNIAIANSQEKNPSFIERYLCSWKTLLWRKETEDPFSLKLLEVLKGREADHHT